MTHEWIGRKIGGCQIADVLGRGGMSTVYRAYQPQLARWVAVKVLEAQESGSEEFLARFRREARAVAALRHPNILTIYDYGEEQGVAYIVMEYVPGGTLSTRLTGRPVEWPDAAALVIPVGRALAYAHSQSIVHRDVKPANVLLARPDWPLLADFGLVKLLGKQKGITRPGITMGTPAYFSPEQAAGDEVDHRADIYGLGLVLYELLTGHLPFEAESPIDMLLRRLSEPPAPPRALNPRISAQVERAIMQAIAREPGQRYPSMGAFVDDLARLAGTNGVAPADTTARLDGGPAAARTCLVVAGTGAVLPLSAQGELLIGRRDPRVVPPPDLDLDPHGGSAAGVSRSHARLQRRAEGWFLEDLGSTNGTYVNDVRLSPGQPVRLHHGDAVHFGQLALSFCE